jgi:hypothetical protein
VILSTTKPCSSRRFIAATAIPLPEIMVIMESPGRRGSWYRIIKPIAASLLIQIDEPGQSAAKASESTHAAYAAPQRPARPGGPFRIAVTKVLPLSEAPA